jgi:hypothetical protein
MTSKSLPNVASSGSRLGTGSAPSGDYSLAHPYDFIAIESSCATWEGQARTMVCIAVRCVQNAKMVTVTRDRWIKMTVLEMKVDRYVAHCDVVLSVPRSSFPAQE